MNKVSVTMDWEGNPITTKDGYILPRKAEMILNSQYYPLGVPGEWPCDPTTGEMLPIWDPRAKPTSDNKIKHNGNLLYRLLRLFNVAK